MQSEVFRAKNYQPARSTFDAELSARVVRLEVRVEQLNSMAKRHQGQYAKVCQQLQRIGKRL